MLGALRSSRELSLPGLVGPGITAPTYLCRFPRIRLQRPRRPRLTFPHIISAMTPLPPPDLPKRALRDWARGQRARAARAAGPRAGNMIARQLVGGVPLREQETVAGYWPVREEADPMPALLRLVARGHRAALPHVMGRTRPLAFRAWVPGDAMILSPFGIPEPRPLAKDVRPTLVLVPGLWFDRAGFRLGYGGGFYDRTLAELRKDGPVLSIGIAYGGQVGGALPREAHDVPVDWIVTERGVIRVSQAKSE